MKFFGKLRNEAVKLYGKVRSQAPKILGKISHGLEAGGKFIDNHLGAVTSLASGILGPQAGAVANGIGQFASKLAHSGSALTNVNSYRGNSEQVVNNALEKAKNIHRTIKDGVSYE